MSKIQEYDVRLILLEIMKSLGRSLLQEKTSVNQAVMSESDLASSPGLVRNCQWSGKHENEIDHRQHQN